jgi:hypothetical protein
MKKKKQIVDLESQRYGLFVTQNSLNLDIMYGRQFLETDNAQEVILHRINLIETKTHSLYGQSKSKDKKFMSPVRLKAMVTIEEGKQVNYGDNPGGIARDNTGNISFGVYLKELEEKQVEINRGDIVEYNMSGEKNRYYEVESANNVTDETKKTIGGFFPYWKKVIGVPVISDVIQLFEGGEKGTSIV